MKNIIILAALLLLSQNIVLADCFTGFACSIADLEDKQSEHYKEIISVIQNYFNKKNLEKNYVTGKYTINNYNDIFSYNTILAYDGVN